MKIANSNTRKYDEELALLNDISPKGYSLGVCIRFGQPSFQSSTMPESWVEEYAENAYILCDPFIAWAVSTAGSMRWSELDVPDVFGILRSARKHGMNYGVTISIGERQSRSILALARPDREFSDAEIIKAKAIAEVIHRDASGGKTLTSGQRNALRMIAEGWKYPQAAERLGIAEGAFKARLVSVRKALGVETTPEAIMKARKEGLL